jgi:hypothetical protein
MVSALQCPPLPLPSGDACGVLIICLISEFRGYSAESLGDHRSQRNGVQACEQWYVSFPSLFPPPGLTACFNKKQRRKNREEKYDAACSGDAWTCAAVVWMGKPVWIIYRVRISAPLDCSVPLSLIDSMYHLSRRSFILCDAWHMFLSTLRNIARVPP